MINNINNQNQVENTEHSLLQAQTVDRISELPLDILVSILFKLQIKDLSQCSQASHLWRFLSSCCIFAKSYQVDEFFALNYIKRHITNLSSNLYNKIPFYKIKLGNQALCIAPTPSNCGISPSARPELYHDPELLFELLENKLENIQLDTHDNINKNNKNFQLLDKKVIYIRDLLILQLNSSISYSTHFFKKYHALKKVTIADSKCFDCQEIPHYLFSQSHFHFNFLDGAVHLVNCGLKNYHLINLPKKLPRILDLSNNIDIKIEPLSIEQIKDLQKNWKNAISSNSNNRDDLLKKIEMLLFWLQIGSAMKDSQAEIHFSPSQLIGFKDLTAKKSTSVIGMDRAKQDDPENSCYAQKYDVIALKSDDITILVSHMLMAITDNEFYEWVTGPEALEMLKSRFLASYKN